MCLDKILSVRLPSVKHFLEDNSWYISRDSCISRHGPRCSHRTRKDSRDDVKEKTISHGLCRHFAEGSPVVEGGHMSRGWWHALQALTSSGVMWAGLPRLSYFSSSFLIEMLKARNWPRSSALLVVRFVLGCKDTMITAVLYVYIPIKIEKAMLSRSSFHVPSLAGVRESALGSVGIIWKSWWTVGYFRVVARWTGNIVTEFMSLCSVRGCTMALRWGYISRLVCSGWEPLLISRHEAFLREMTDGPIFPFPHV